LGPADAAIAVRNCAALFRCSILGAVMPKLLLIRHCEATGQYPDAPLTAAGTKDAEALCARLRDLSLDAVYSSPYKRAHASVRPFAVLAGLPVRLDDRIRERVLSQALARPGTLVVADSTRRQLGTLFEIEDLGPPISSPMLRHDDRASLQGEILSALSPPGGCPFHTSCHRKVGTSCETQNPVEQRLAQGSHRIVCHIPADELARLTAASERTAP
jgi:hypothetical protein